MAQAFRAAGTPSDGNNTSISAGGAPAGVAANDILLCVLTIALPGSSNTQPTVTTPGGWTLLANNSNQSTSAGDGMWVFGRVATGTDTMPSFSIGATSMKYTNTVYAWSGVPGNALPAVSIVSTGNGTTGTTVTAGTVNVASPAWVAVVVSGRSSTNTTYTVSGGTALTVRTASGLTAPTVPNAAGGGSVDQVLGDTNGTVSGATIGGETFTAGTTSTWQNVAIIQFAATTNATVTAVVATATASDPAPVVSGAAVVTAVAATATATDPAPTVSGTATVAGVAATGTAAAPAPSVSGTANIAAVVATATADTPAPTFSTTANVTAVVATATATDPVPTVVAGSGTIVVPPPAIATADAPAPTIVAISNATVAAVTGTATAGAPAPAVATTGNALVLAVSAPVFATAPRPVINHQDVVHIPLTARLNIDRVIINLAVDLSQFVSAGSAGAIGGGSSRADTHTQDGEFRQYAGGRVRLIQGTATSRVLDPLVLRALTPDQVAKLLAWTGKTVQVRDSYGRRLFGSYLQPVVTDIPLSGTAGSTLLSDVQLVITEESAG